MAQTKLRPTAFRELEDLLDKTYFSKEAFSINSDPRGADVFAITFMPNQQYMFKVHQYNDGFITTETPGKYLTSELKIERDSFRDVMVGIEDWANRIRDDYRIGPRDSDIDEFIEQLRKNILKGSEGTGDFSAAEIEELRSKLDALTQVVQSQSEKLNATEEQFRAFEKEIDDIKRDLESMPKGTWHKVAGGKIIRAIKGFIGTPEGRRLIADGIKRLIGLGDS